MSNETLERYIVRDREAGNIIVDSATLSDALAQLDLMEQEDRQDGTYEADFYEIYDSEDEEIVDLYEYRCDKCGRILSDNDWLFPLGDYHYECADCINASADLSKDEEYCFGECEWRNLHYATHEICDNCKFKFKCKLFEFLTASEED